ncbi:hypothetical protein [Marinimicrobium sp. ABcell2]|uniref:hypothetical protein n=1 Tax=Marinimicrobium sp. ABcell2 TaxID=3069751 RepID=UPI0027B46D31|nr:hypothetical protein [Marinimicrobium sp. ABcell2]MDQ2077387.1 hypothetical protein [Marinimicrobium sp. ABcell2]
MSKTMDRRKVILYVFGALVVGGYAFYEFVLYDDGYGAPTNQLGLQEQQQREDFIPAPREATLPEFREATEDPELVDPHSRSVLENLYHRRTVAQIEADIATFERQKEQAVIEAERGRAEIEELRARVERENRLTQIQEHQARESRSTPEPVHVFQEASAGDGGSAVNARIDQLDAEIERRLRQATPKPEQSATLHQVNGQTALVTVDGSMRRLTVGQAAGGVRLVSTDADQGAAVLQGVASGERASLAINDNTSRRFGVVQPIGNQQGGGGSLQSSTDITYDPYADSED